MPVRKMGVFSLILLEVCKNSFSNKIDIYPVSYHDTKIMIVELNLMFSEKDTNSFKSVWPFQKTSTLPTKSEIETYSIPRIDSKLYQRLLN